MPTRAPSPPLFRIYTATQTDNEIVAQAREAVLRSIRVLHESRSVTRRIGYRNQELRPLAADQDDKV